MWKHLLQGVEPFEASQRMPLFIQRTTAHFPNAPIATLLARNKVPVLYSVDVKVCTPSYLGFVLQVSGLTQLYSFDPISGAALEDVPREGVQLQFVARQVTLVQELSEKFVRPLLLLDSQGEVRATATVILLNLLFSYRVVMFFVPFSTTCIRAR